MDALSGGRFFACLDKTNKNFFRSNFYGRQR
jgi:hypothetical protein